MEQFAAKVVRRRFQLGVLVLFGGLVSAFPIWAQLSRSGGGTDPIRYPEGSAEHVALSAASKHMRDVNFALRQEYWQGELSGSSGKAIKLQLFPHTEYRLYLATAPDDVPKGTKLHVKIVDRKSTVVASSSSKFKSSVAVAKFVPEKTGLYMVLMRLEAPKGESPELAARCVLFYGYE